LRAGDAALRRFLKGEKARKPRGSEKQRRGNEAPK